MRAIRQAWIGLGLLFGAAFAAAAAAPPLPPAPAGTAPPVDEATAAFFETRIRPLLHEKCFSCHAGPTPQGRLVLTSRAGLLKGGSRGPAVVPGHPEQSLLLRALRHDGVLKMPPTERLPDRQVAEIADWIRLGAPWPVAQAVQPAAAADSSPAGKSAPPHWAFRPVRRPALPAVKGTAWVRTPVDRFILAKLEARRLSPAPPADRRTLIRRATFDLIGLPPTPEAIEAFAADRAPDAWARVVDRLLADPRYGERWGRYWLDVARFADTRGYIYTGERRYPFAYTYRDWVIRAFNEDLPYDRFLLLQIAADQLLAETGEPDNGGKDLAAMGFLTLGRRFVNMQPDIIDDRLDVVFRGTQGLTVGCARCHDHKFDPIPTADYYSLYGVFAASTERTVRIGPEPERTATLAAYETELAKRQGAFDTAMEQARAALSDRLRARVGGYLAMVPGAAKLPGEEFYVIMGADDVNPIIVRSWRAYLDRFRGADDPVWNAWHAFEALPDDQFGAQAPALARQLAQDAAGRCNPRVAERFAGSPPTGMADVAARYGQLLAAVHERWQTALKEAKEKGAPVPAGLPDPADEALRQVLYRPDSPASIPRLRIGDLEYYFDEKTRNDLNELQAKVDRWHLQSPEAPPQALVLEDLPPQPNPRVFRRGNPSNKGEEVPRRFLLALAGPRRRPFQQGSGRLELARAIASRDNPLTARVMVNRVWQGHFGQGLIRTPSDFGRRSEPPTHPELLDWLAWSFARGGDRGTGAWRLKPIHRLLMLSATYQQASTWLPPRPRSATASLAQRPPDPQIRRHRPPRGHPRGHPRNPQSIDPENRLLWRMNRRRLDFEALRDSLLFASGQLDAAMGGPPVDLLAPPFSRRRAVYGLVDRQNLPGLFRVFDFANPDRHSPQRYVTTSPQQALFMLNSPFVIEQARHLVERPAVAGAAAAAERIERLHRLLYGRAPTPAQAQAGLHFLAASAAAVEASSPWQYGWAALADGGQALRGFQPLPYFNGEAWQGGAAWPDPALGWLRLTAGGGHAGNDAAHAVVRRWVAPGDGVVEIAGTLRHGQKEGDGVQALLFSGPGAPVARWEAHNAKVETTVARLTVRKGDPLDFVVDSRAGVSNDDFEWAPVVRLVEPAGAPPAAWDAARDFAGPALSPWEQYAQALLLANEFVFVD